MAAEDEVVRRNRPGTKAEDLFNWPFQEYTDMDIVGLLHYLYH